ncbi:hypothetical protein DFH09DRAFT_1431740 [Mycena vulgaris]|nr:hypothetical protein DFH09DRAFT_1431740 [Mycena vulgaris]
MILVYLAMRYKQHAAAAQVGALFTIAGHGTWLATVATYIQTRYTCLFLNTMGGCYEPTVLTWTSNARCESTRALTAAVISGAVGDAHATDRSSAGAGSIVGSWSYFPTDTKTGYHIGSTLSVSLAVVVSTGIAALWFFEYMANRRKCKPSDGDTDSSFRYVL